MIKFFRKIRFNLMETRKTGKYFTYAIGEIVLVVIGILIALQINNWNEYKNQLKTEKEMLTSLKSELINTKNELDTTFIKNSVYLEHGVKMLDTIKKNYAVFKEIDYSRIFNYYSGNINTPVLKAILTSDYKMVSSSEAFISQLRVLDLEIEDTKLGEHFLDDFWKSRVTDFFIKAGIGYTSVRPAGATISIKDLSKMGYDKNQILALIALNGDLLRTWLNSQKESSIKIDQVLKVLHQKLNGNN